MPKPLAPGPVALPLVGALPQIGLGMLAPGLAEQPHRRLAALSQTYGDVMTVNFGREPWLVLSSPEAVHEAFVTKGGDFAGRPQVASMSLSAGSGRAGFGRPLPDAGLRELRRAAYSTLFSDEAVAAKQSELEAEAHLLSDHLLATSGTGEPLRPSLRRCVGNMVLRFAFSSRVPYASEEGAAAPPAPIAELLRLTEAIWDSLAATPTTVLDLLGVLDAEYVFMYPTSTREDAYSAVIRCIQLCAAVFTVFLSVVFTRCSEYTAQYRLHALMSAYFHVGLVCRPTTPHASR